MGIYYEKKFKGKGGGKKVTKLISLLILKCHVKSILIYSPRQTFSTQVTGKMKKGGWEITKLKEKKVEMNAEERWLGAQEC